MKTQHTPGPWQWDHPNGKRELPDFAESRDLLRDRECIGHQVPTVIGHVKLYGENDERDANARLIAAAPELKAMLAECVSCLNIQATIYGGLSPAATDTRDNARALLARLEGGE